MKPLPWKPGGESIPFFIGSDCCAEVGAQLKSLAADLLIVIADPSAWDHHGSRYEPALRSGAPIHILRCKPGETEKSLAQVDEIAQQAIAAGATRRSVLLAAGGGIVGNLTGLTAALLFRGIRFVHLPTTLLAMHDSVTSLKQGVNCGGVKNIVGTFHRPSAIFVDVAFLQTLPPAHLRSGLVELVKNALLLAGEYSAELTRRLAPDKQLAATDWESLIELGIRAKYPFLYDDPHETASALIFEYGHTVGHALELACAGQLSHGDSIAWGMRCAAWVSAHLRHMTADGLREHNRLLSLLGPLPKPPIPPPLNEIRWRISKDNKRGYAGATAAEEIADSTPMVLLQKPGVLVESGSSRPLIPVSDEAIDAALRQLQEIGVAAPTPQT
jgi:3-dehydroquinate synthase/2-deoxy-scyllo-inosose synthase